jgi:hypothetical protein
MIRCTLVAGGTAAQRLAAIAAGIDPAQTTAVIAEGPQDGAGLPGAIGASDRASEPASHRAGDPAIGAGWLRLAVIAAGCPHCDAGLVMRVTLDRILRQRPAALYISLADPHHLEHLQQFLSSAPYASLLRLAPVLAA